MKHLFLLVAAIAASVAGRPAIAGRDAKGTIESFDAALLDIMKSATKLGYQGRYQKFTPLLEQTFDLPLMARISVGPQWSSLTTDQQAKVIEAFKHLSIATFASRFDDYGGEQIQIVNEKPLSCVAPCAADDVIDTKMLRPKEDAVDLNYRLHQDGGDWKVMDVYLAGTISQLANYRSEFSTTLRNKGADGLIELIDKKVADLAAKK